MEWVVSYMVINWLTALAIMIHSKYTDPVKTQALLDDFQYDIRNYSYLGKVGAYLYGFTWAGLMTIPSLVLKQSK